VGRLANVSALELTEEPYKMPSAADHAPPA
jgi:hypothetical protein